MPSLLYPFPITHMPPPLFPIPSLLQGVDVSEGEARRRPRPGAKPETRGCVHPPHPTPKAHTHPPTLTGTFSLFSHTQRGGGGGEEQKRGRAIDSVPPRGTPSLLPPSSSSSSSTPAHPALSPPASPTHPPTHPTGPRSPPSRLPARPSTSHPPSSSSSSSGTLTQSRRRKIHQQQGTKD